MAMTMTMSSAPASGMRDLLPAEVSLRDWAIATVLRTYEQFGFTRIETPAMEHIDLLRRGEGGENLQLIFEVLKRGEKLERELQNETINRDELADLGLRFDLTVPLVRFYAANQANLPTPLKAIQIGPVWRAERPQKGRFRQFTQCDIDIIGVKSELAEMELIQATCAALRGLSFQDFTVRINDRRILSELVEFCQFSEDKSDIVFIALDKLDKIGIEGVRKDLQTLTHSGEATDRLIGILTSLMDETDFDRIKAALPKTICPEALAALKNVIDAVSATAGGTYSIRLDPTLVRGMGYYTGQIFEISNPGYTSSIAGGGRYDKMVGKFAGRDTPACGFSIGFERIIAILMEKGFKPPSDRNKIAFICEPDRDQPQAILAAAEKLRTEGHIVSILPRKKDMKKQLDSLVTENYTHYASYRPDNIEVKQLHGPAGQ
jgi:histidyl-tRNA synthetase